MEDTQTVATLIDSTTSKIQQLQRAFAELEKDQSLTLNLKWKELEAHLHGLEKSLKRRFHEVEDQEKEYETKTIQAQETLEKREAAVVAKEQASMERLQVKRDSAIFALTNGIDKNGEVPLEEPAIATSDSHDIALTFEEKPPDTMVTENGLEDKTSSSKCDNFEMTFYPELVKLCQQMDAKGLHKFISDNRKNLAAIKEEIPVALKAAANPAHLVLDSLEDFYRAEAPNVDGKKDSDLLGVRRSCIMLMECLDILLRNANFASVSEAIPQDVKDRAKAIAEEWKPKLGALDMDASNGNSLEAHAFLQLLATYGITSDFDKENICKLIPMVSRRRQTADLCRSLGLSEKMPGVIEVLINSGRQIDAVNMAFSFQRTEQFSPIPLLKAYLKDSRKVSSPIKPGNTHPSAQSDVNERELNALKAVIKCTEDHKLEKQYSLDPLRKRVFLLEKVKADMKRATEAAKPQPKRPRATAIGCGPRVTNIAPEKMFYARATDKYPPPPPPQYIYDLPYVYPGPTDNHCPSILGSAPYSLSHGNYFVNGYQYQAPYLH